MLVYCSLIHQREFERTDHSPKAEKVVPVVLLLSGSKKQISCEYTYHWNENSTFVFRVIPVYKMTVTELMEMSSFWLAFAPIAVDTNAENLAKALKVLRERIRSEKDLDRKNLHLAAANVMLELAKKHCKKRPNLATMVINRLEDFTMRTIQEAEMVGEKRGEIRGEIRGEKRGEQKALLEMAAYVCSQDEYDELSAIEDLNVLRDRVMARLPKKMQS
jgi:hypothetical protein